MSSVVPAEAQVIFNGSFEADYAGWSLSEAPYAPGLGLDPRGSFWGIGVSGETLADGGSVLDLHDMTVVQVHDVTMPGLPITWEATDGNAVAFHLQTQSGHHKLWQDVVLPAGATHLSWDMQYNNHLGLFDSFLGENHLVVSLRNPADGSLLAELFRTIEGASADSEPEMKGFSAGIAAFAGQSVRIEVELKNLSSFDLVLDDFVVLPDSGGGGDAPPPSDEPPTAGMEIQVRDRINPRSRGVVAVGILGGPTFDPATSLDRSSIVSGTATPAHGGHVEDVNGDGYPDLVVHFEVPLLALSGALRSEGSSGELCVLGTTMDDEALEGCTSVGLTGGGSR